MPRIPGNAGGAGIGSLMAEKISPQMSPVIRAKNGSLQSAKKLSIAQKMEEAGVDWRADFLKISSFDRMRAGCRIRLLRNGFKSAKS